MTILLSLFLLLKKIWPTSRAGERLQTWLRFSPRVVPAFLHARILNPASRAGERLQMWLRFSPRVAPAFLFVLVGAVAIAGFGLRSPFRVAEETGFAGEYPAVPLYTVMIYMNGSDLESEFGAATDDLAEMLDSGVNSRAANVLILTGGTNRWQNSAIPAAENVIWQLADGRLNEVHSMGSVNMGDPDTLRDFIRFCTANFPAERTGLIMWDHGGGSIAGFGHDEKFNDASLTLQDMQQAFCAAGLREQKLEFLGFDACLMATVEMAIIAAEFADVLIAAVDLEPGEGWDYGFLATLNENPCGFTLGEIIVDSFFDYFVAAGLYDEEVLTLSVVDLAAVMPVMDALGELARAANPAVDFMRLAQRRAHTKTFGAGSPRDNYADMVDISDMAAQLADIFPREAAALQNALAAAVTYSRHNLDVEIGGLSTFYIYGGKSEGIASLRTYAALEMDGAYTAFLHRFFDELVAARKNEVVSDTNHFISTQTVLWEKIGETYRLAGLQKCAQRTAKTEDTSPSILSQSDSASLHTKNLWATLNGEFVPLFPVGETANARRYAIPARVNGREADIIAVFTQEFPRGKILGVRYNADNVFQKGHDPLQEGDEIAFLHFIYDFTTGVESWLDGEIFILDETPLQILWREAPADFIPGRKHTDVWGDVLYTPPAPQNESKITTT